MGPLEGSEVAVIEDEQGGGEQGGSERRRARTAGERRDRRPPRGLAAALGARATDLLGRASPGQRSDAGRAAPLDRGGLDAEPDLALAGRSAARGALLAAIGRLGPAPVAVVLFGECGSGQAAVARALHARSPRRLRPFVRRRVGGLGVLGADDATLVDPLERSRGGTLFLDGLGDAAPEVGGDVLLAALGPPRAPQSAAPQSASPRPPEAPRLILGVQPATAAAGDAARAAELADGLARALGGERLLVPPLRARRDDIPELARRALERLNRRYGQARELAEDALRALARLELGGNVSELVHLIERLVLFGSRKRITARDLYAELAQGRLGRAVEPLAQLRERVEQAVMRDALLRFAGEASSAARAIGLSMSTLRRKLRR